MKQSVPVVRQVNFLALLLPLMVIVGGSVGVGLWLRPPLGISAYFIVPLLVLVYVVLAQAILLRHHRNGLRLLRAARPTEALLPLQKALEFYTEHPALDRWRHFLLITASSYSLREVALMNIAYCYSQAGDKEEMIKHYECLLREYPNNVLVQNTLRLIETSQQDG